MCSGYIRLVSVFCYSEDINCCQGISVFPVFCGLLVGECVCVIVFAVFYTLSASIWCIGVSVVWWSF